MDLLQKILGLEFIALLEMPQTVVFPGSHVVWIRRERSFVPNLGQIVVAEFAVGITDIVCHLGALIVTEQPKRSNRVRVLAIEHKGTRRAVAVNVLLIVALGALLLSVPLLLGCLPGSGRLADILARGRQGRWSNIAGGHHRKDWQRQGEQTDNHRSNMAIGIAPGHGFPPNS